MQSIDNVGRLTIMVNTSISSDLPFEKRNITVQLASQTQLQTVMVPNETAQFSFGYLNSIVANYSLSVSFLLWGSYPNTTMMNTSSIIITTSNNGAKAQITYTLVFLIIAFFYLFL